MSTARNSSAITFPTPTGGWGRPNQLVFYDAISGGNIMLRGSVSISNNINSGDTVQVPAQGCTITVNNTTNFFDDASVRAVAGIVGLDFDEVGTNQRNDGTSVYAALATSGTEVSGNGYRRVSVRTWDIAKS